MHPAEIISRNMSGEDLWFLDSTGNATFIPGGWYQWFTLANHAGLSAEDFDANEIYGYAPVSKDPNSQVDTIYVSTKSLAMQRAVDEDEAYKSHPQMQRHLKLVNEGAI